MTEYHISDLIYKSLTGQLSNKEQGDFKNWLNENDNQAFYKKISNSKTIQNKFDVYNSFNSFQAYARISKKIEIKKGKVVKLNHNLFFKYAAMVFIALGLGWSVYTLVSQPKEEAVELTTIQKTNPSGQKSTFKLPDGTIVNLNAASSVSYYNDIEKKRRIVTLEGEAFFEVAENKLKPFTVISGNLSTTALGTSFNIKAYPNENTHKVSLVTGKVEIANLEFPDNEKMYLAPGFGVLYSRESKELDKYNFDEARELGWKNKILYFEEADIDNVIGELERWYGVKITIENKEKVRQWNYNGKFENESLENVLNGIGFIQEFEYEIDDKNVTLKF